jgi:hypothetical protein
LAQSFSPEPRFDIDEQAALSFWTIPKIDGPHRPAQGGLAGQRLSRMAQQRAQGLGLLVDPLADPRPDGWPLAKAALTRLSSNVHGYRFPALCADRERRPRRQPTLLGGGIVRDGRL